MNKRPTIRIAVLVAVLLATTAALAAVEQIPLGIKFTYSAPGAAQVTLAGSFNGWDPQRHPLEKGKDGTWFIVMALKPGKYEYKFVVDGSWFADPDNPETVPDSFGGANSVVVIGDDGKLVPPARRAAAAGARSTLNARLTLDGRYLGRYMAVKDYDGDPRYRLHRPEQKVDLNFRTAVSDVVDAYTRLRLDNTTSINMNDITADLDEGSVDIHPGAFHVLGYWNMEVLELDDPLSLGGDVDLPGTLLDDHLPGGKGSAGVVFDGRPLGLRYHGFFSDVHDEDYDNDLTVFDNSGRDLFGSRLSTDLLGCEVGLPVYMERNLIWTDMGTFVGQPGGTGLPALDRYLAENDDSSTWFEWDDLDLRAGLDLTRGFADGKGRLQLEWLYQTRKQRFVTGNEAGANNTNGPVDIVFVDRARRIWHGELRYEPRPGRTLNLEHTWYDESGAAPGESPARLTYLPDDQANKRVYVTFGDVWPQTSRTYSEFTWLEEADGRRHLFWLQRYHTDADYGLVGAAAPTGAATADATTWIVTVSNGIGRIGDRYGWFDLENAWTDHDDGITGRSGHTFETILRWERKLSPRLNALVNVRWLEASLDDAGDGTGGWHDTYLDPFVGLRYLPHPRMDVVVAYGVDPMDFRIDYDGRRTGRWLYRYRYLQDHAGATERDAEQALEDARVITLRANLRF